MTWRSPCLVPALAIITAWAAPARADLPAEISDAIAWYDSQGFPNARDLSYVRVPTGTFIIGADRKPAPKYVEGFLIQEDDSGFKVFVCSQLGFDDTGADQWLAEHNFGAYTRVLPSAPNRHVSHEPLDFKKAASDFFEKARAPQPSGAGPRPPSIERLRIFFYARACLQKELHNTGSALMEIARSMPDENTGKPDPRPLRDKLQDQVGDLDLAMANLRWSVPANPLDAILKDYEYFLAHCPGSPKLASVQESADLVRKMITEEAAHHPKPLDQMSPEEQVAENIYQLRTLSRSAWSMQAGRPLKLIFVKGGKAEAPVQRLLDLGYKAVPQLIESLDDRRFTRCAPAFRGLMARSPVRVGDFAREILANIAAREFSGNAAETRQQAEAWWEEAKKKGEKQMLVAAASTGGPSALTAAHRIAEKYPDSAMDAIKAGFRATKEESDRGEFVELAGSLPGKAPLAFLKSALTAGNGIPSQVSAAHALTTCGESDIVPAMIKAWQSAQPRIAADEPTIYQQIGPLISFLAKSGNPDAIDALGQAMRKAPIDERLAILRIFEPAGTSSTSFATGNHSPNFPLDLADLLARKSGASDPQSKTAHAIESLLISALGDTERRLKMKGSFNTYSYEDPRVCDFAAAILSGRQPTKYQFRWSSDAKQCDAQIAVLRDKSRADSATPRIHLQ